MPPTRRQPEPAEPSLLRRFAFPAFVVVSMLLLVADAVWDLKTSAPVPVDPAQAEANAATAAWGIETTIRWVWLVVGVLLFRFNRRRPRLWP